MARKEKKKNTRMRGRTTHGWGSMKKHRGAGNRGGRGNSGSTKHKGPSYGLKGADKVGFKNLSSSKAIDVAINVCDLDILAQKMIANGKLKEEGGSVSIDLNLLGIDKLLGKGSVSSKYNVSVAKATEAAKAKIEEAGGSLTVAE